MKFLWGASTAATQVEGGYDKDGKSLTIWDVASTTGHIRDGHTTFDACNCYNNEQTDIKMLSLLGANVYRFSLSWARIIPDGTGKVNMAGVGYYNRLIDGLLAKGIEPFITLYHWDLPQCLQDKGGFLNSDFADWFEHYATEVAKLFGDRVTYFSTFNEPECICSLGYGTGNHAPYIKGGVEQAVRAAHNLLRANARAFRALKKYCKTDVKVGLVSAFGPRIPQTEADLEAARKATFDSCYYDRDSLFNNAWFFDAAIFGKYPEHIRKNFSVDIRFTEEQMQEVICPLDFLGLNIYQGVYAKSDGKGGYYDPHVPLNTPKAGGANMTPSAIYYGPKFASERYNLPVYVTENGLMLPDVIGIDGKVNDDTRVKYIHDYVGEIIKARKDGIDVRGYMHWSLYDNLEWNSGFSARFGLIYTDYVTFEKIPKKSFYYYKQLIEQNKEI